MFRALLHFAAFTHLRRKAVAASVCIAVAGTPFAVYAQNAFEAVNNGASYITPFPPNDIYKAQVYGDVFVDGLLRGMSENLKPEDKVDLPRKARTIGSLVRSDFEEDLGIEEQSKDVVHIGVVMLGFNDRGTLRSPNAPSARFGTPAWKSQYSQRVDRLLKALKRRGLALYVVGSPPLRRSDANVEMEAINETLVDRAFANGLKFVEIAEAFTDENGAYSQFGPDSTGNREKLRDGDGVDFTAVGYRKLAGLITAEIRKDLAAARAERAVPLAGSEVEQKRINPDKAGAVVTPTGWKGVVTKDAKDARATSASASTSPTAVSAATGQRSTLGSQGDQKAETVRISLRLPGMSGREDVMQVEIVRPAISAAVIALLNRKENVEAAQQQPFDMLADDVGDGISVSTLVTAQEGPQAANRRRGPTTQAAYAAVWVRGDRLPPKPGRADDFAWPRPGDVPEAMPVTGTIVPPANKGPATVTPQAAARAKARLLASPSSRSD